MTFTFSADGHRALVQALDEGLDQITLLRIQDRAAELEQSQSAQVEPKDVQWSYELRNLIYNTLQFYANVTSYQGERTGGVLQGCPREPAPSAEMMVIAARSALRRVESELGRPDPFPYQSQSAQGDFIDIVFDGPPGPNPGRFVEVENSKGASIRFGEWVHREDGRWVLRIQSAGNAGEVAGWQPIETAPKDGRWILLGRKWSGVRPFIGRYGKGAFCWFDERDTIRDPDRWQPLPEPPHD